jgi:hypothetical protein
MVAVNQPVSTINRINPQWLVCLKSQSFNLAAQPINTIWFNRPRHNPADNRSCWNELDLCYTFHSHCFPLFSDDQPAATGARIPTADGSMPTRRVFCF